MKHLSKFFLIPIFLILLSNNSTLQAVPAYPHPVDFYQPDGSTITVILKGDEFLNWKETLDGYTLLHNAKGLLEYAIIDKNNMLVPSGIMAVDINKRDITQQNYLSKISKKAFFSKTQIEMSKQIRKMRDTEILKMQKSPLDNNVIAEENSSSAFPTLGNKKLICILMEYKNRRFTLTQQDFNNLFNQVNYSTGGATGSVKDYYIENSYNQFNLTVDVVGPFVAKKDSAFYGNNTNGTAGTLISEAVAFADTIVNFADYDNDNDGKVDGVYVIFAGYGEEAGAGDDAIWSHAGSINTTKDGKSIRSYSCSPELRGNKGTSISRIGVICHEFGHVLGAPDFYDTNGNDTGDGSYSGTGSWDMMAGGTWNNGGATPAHHNGYTKVVHYKWANVTTLNTPQIITLSNAAENPNSFYFYF